MAALRLLFMGTAKLSCTVLQALADCADFQLVAVVTQPDRPKGRQLKLQASPVKELALQLGLPVLQPERAREPLFLAHLRQLAPDLIAVAAYGQILPPTILELPRLGCLNVHTSLLPRYRGAAPIQWTILHDEPQTGVTIMKMDAGLDTGPILTQAQTDITAQDTSETLHERLGQMGGQLLCQTIPGYVSGHLRPYPQPAEGATLAPRIKKEDGRIDWSQGARAIWNRVRGLVPWPGAFAFLPKPTGPELLKIWQAEPAEISGPAGQVLQADRNGILVGCGRDALRVLQLQREGGRRLSAQDFLSGHPLARGQQLG